MIRPRRPGPRLPLRPLRGRFAITDAAVQAGERLLPTYRGPDGDHEGVLFLLGFELPLETLYVSVLAPEAEHSFDRVFVDRPAALAAFRTARRHGLGILGQAHSHPGGWTEHSIGDDAMVFMPFEGMLSLVAPHYGSFGLRPLDGLGVHQFQDGRWVLGDPTSVRDQLRILPVEIDLR